MLVKTNHFQNKDPPDITLPAEFKEFFEERGRIEGEVAALVGNTEGRAH